MLTTSLHTFNLANKVPAGGVECMLRAKITGIQGRECLNILTHHSIENQNMLGFFLHLSLSTNLTNKI